MQWNVIRYWVTRITAFSKCIGEFRYTEEGLLYPLTQILMQHFYRLDFVRLKIFQLSLKLLRMMRKGSSQDFIQMMRLSVWEIW